MKEQKPPREIRALIMAEVRKWFFLGRHCPTLPLGIVRRERAGFDVESGIGEKRLP